MLRTQTATPVPSDKDYRHIPIHVSMSKVTQNLLTSDKFMNYVFETGFFWDSLYTVPRLVSVAWTCMQQRFAAGPMIEYMAAHPEVSIPYFVSTLLLCSVGFHQEYKKQLDAHKKKAATFQSLFMNLERELYLNPVLETMSEDEQAAHYNALVQTKVDCFNNEIEAILAENPGLKKKYKKFQLRPSSKTTYAPTAGAETGMGIRKKGKIDIRNSDFLVLARTDQELAEIAQEEQKEAKNKAIEKQKRYQQHGLTDAEVKGLETKDGGLELNPAQDEQKPKVEKNRMAGLKRFWKNYIVPVWNKTMALRTGIFISAFIYWLEWIAASTFNGGQMGIGVIGMHPIAAFGIPALFGGTYLAIRAYHYIKNDEWHKTVEESAKTKQAELESEAIIAEANRRVELKLAIQESERLFKELRGRAVPYNTPDFHVTRSDLFGDLEGGAWARGKALNTFVTAFIAEQNEDQYIYWIMTDAVQLAFTVAMTLPFVNLAVGLVVAGVSAFMAGVAAYKRHQEVSSEKQPDVEEGRFTRPKITLDYLEKTYDNDKKILANLLREVNAEQQAINDLIKNDRASNGYLPKNVNLVPAPTCVVRASLLVEPKPSEAYDKGKDASNNIMSGAFFVRLLFVAGTAIFIAFNVSTFGIPAIVGLAALTVAFCWLKNKETKHKKELTRSKELMGKIPEIEQEIEIMKRERENLKLRKSIIEANLREAAQAEEVRYTPPYDAELSPKRKLSDSDNPSIAATTVASTSSPDEDISHRGRGSSRGSDSGSGPTTPTTPEESATFGRTLSGRKLVA